VSHGSCGSRAWDLLGHMDNGSQKMTCCHICFTVKTIKPKLTQPRLKLPMTTDAISKPSLCTRYPPARGPRNELFALQQTHTATQHTRTTTIITITTIIIVVYPIIIGYTGYYRRLVYCSPDTPTFNDLCDNADDELFNKATLDNLLHALLPPTLASSQRYNLRQRPHLLQLPEH